MEKSTNKKGKKEDIEKSLTKEGLEYLKKYGELPTPLAINDGHFRLSGEADQSDL